MSRHGSAKPVVYIIAICGDTRFCAESTFGFCKHVRPAVEREKLSQRATIGYSCFIIQFYPIGSAVIGCKVFCAVIIIIPFIIHLHQSAHIGICFFTFDFRQAVCGAVIFIKKIVQRRCNIP